MLDRIISVSGRLLIAGIIALLALYVLWPTHAALRVAAGLGLALIAWLRWRRPQAPDRD